MVNRHLQLHSGFPPSELVFVPTMSIRAKNRNKTALRRGFSLIELLSVLAVMSLLSGFLVISIPGMKSSQDVTTAAYDVQGVLEQARITAMANNTYTWVGFFEENPNNPGTAGTGQVVISVVSSGDGTQTYSNASAPTALPSTSLAQVSKLMKIPNSHLDVLTAAAVTRPSVPANTYQVGNSAFANGTTFPYPLSGTPTYTFTNIIQFNPQGDATRIVDVPTQWMEIGLRPSHGSSTDTASKNVVAVQISGIGGKVTVYRP